MRVRFRAGAVAGAVIVALTFAPAPAAATAPERALEIEAAPPRYDRVEGLYAGLRGGAALGTGSGPRLAGELGFAGVEKKAHGELLVGVGAARPSGASWIAGLAARDLVDTRDAWRAGDWETNLACLALGDDPRDYFGRRGIAALAKFESAGTSLLGEWRAERILSLAEHAVWNFRGRVPRANPPAGEGYRHSIHLQMRRGPEEGERWWRLGGEGDFLTRHPATRSWRVELRRGGMPGESWRLAGRVVVAGSGGGAPPEWRYGLGGVGTLRGLAFNEMRGDGLWLVSAGASDGGAVASWTRIPLLRHLGLAAILESGAPRGARDPGTASGSATSAALGAGDVGGYARLELARRVDRRRAPLRLYLRLNAPL